METDKLVEIDHVTDYISREAMHKANRDEWQGVFGFVDCDIFEDNENMIDRVPAADVVEVVRCRECIHSSDHDCPISWGKTDNDFCSFAERI